MRPIRSPRITRNVKSATTGWPSNDFAMRSVSKTTCPVRVADLRPELDAADRRAPGRTFFTHGQERTHTPFVSRPSAP